MNVTNSSTSVHSRCFYEIYRTLDEDRLAHVEVGNMLAKTPFCVVLEFFFEMFKTFTH